MFSLHSRVRDLLNTHAHAHAHAHTHTHTHTHTEAHIHTPVLSYKGFSHVYEDDIWTVVVVEEN